MRPYLHDRCDPSLVEIRDEWTAADLVEVHAALDIVDEMKRRQAEEMSNGHP